MPYVPALFTTLSLTTVGWSPRPLATMPSLPVQAMWFPVKVKRSQPGGVGDGGQLGGLKKLAMIPCAWIFALPRSEEHTSELQSQSNLVCRLLLEKKKNTPTQTPSCRIEV